MTAMAAELDGDEPGWHLIGSADRYWRS